MKRRTAILAAASLAVCWAWVFIERAEGHTRITTEITWGQYIRPILREKCMMCHHPGGIAPDYVDLTVYGTDVDPGARAWAVSIEEMILTDQMPPWKADHRFGTFSNARRLTQQEIDLIVAWVRGGGPQGPLRDLPIPPEFVDSDWLFGDPDITVEMPEAHVLPADQVYDSVTVAVPLDIEEDAWITGLEFLPANPKNVYSMTAFLHDPEGVVIEPIEVEFQKEYDPFADEDDLEGTRMRDMPEGPHYLGQWVRGDQPILFPDAAGRKLRKGSSVELRIVYERPEFADWSEEVRDQSKLGLHLAGPDEEIDLLVESKLIEKKDFVVKANESNQEVRTSYTVDENVHLIGFNPHLGLLGKSLSLHATYPDGLTKNLLWIPEYKHKWGSSFVFEKPVSAPIGTRLDLVARYDNSEDNWTNPNNPPEDVAAGKGRTDAQLYAVLDYTLDDHLYVTPEFVPDEKPRPRGEGMNIFAQDFLLDQDDPAPLPENGESGGKGLLETVLAQQLDPDTGGDEVYWCPMRGSAVCPIHDYHRPGECDTCGMTLRPKSSFLQGKSIAPDSHVWTFSKTGVEDVYWCINRGRADHELTDYSVPGPCPICGEPLAHKSQFTAAHTYMCMTPECERYQSIYFGPGLCPSCGQPVIGMGHMDHNPVHGGWLFMAPNLYHHLEGTMPEEGEFRMYFYDDWKAHLDPRNFSARLFIEHEDEDTGDVNEVEFELGLSKEGDPYFTAQVPPVLPLSFYTVVNLSGQEERFDFEFDELTTEPDPADRPSAILFHNDADYVPIEVPDSVPAILSLIVKQDGTLQQHIEAQQWLAFHAPAYDTKHLAAGLVQRQDGLNIRQRGSLKKAVSLVNVGAMKLEAAGHAMDEARTRRGYKTYEEGIAQIREIYKDAYPGALQ